MKWLPVAGYEGLYEISNMGQVKSLRKNRVMSPAITGKGYPHVVLYKAKVGQSVNIHVLVANAFLGPRPSHLEINHIDGNKTNNTVENLEYVTKLQNAAHCRNVLGTRIEGERHGAHKLTETDVEIIRQARQAGETLLSIASRWNICEKSVGNIVNRRSWRHI